MELTTLSFSSLISAYKKLQSGLILEVRALASDISAANPAQFILLQFQMAQVTQVGDTISNLISQVNNTISRMVQNQKS